MMTPCKKLYYAIEAVLYIAYNANPRPINSKDISSQQGLPPRYLEQIMQKLVHGGILKGVRGPKGGYQLAKEPRKILLVDICHLVNEEDIINSVPNTTELGNLIVRPHWEKICSELDCELEKISIAHLCEEATQKRVPKARSSKMDFSE